MQFQKYLEKTSQEIQKELSAITAAWDKKIQQEIRKLKKPHDLFLESISGGKNIRGTLVKLGYDLAKGSGHKDILTPAVAYEILHTSFLIHDDIIDKSTLRRGKPTLYQALGGDHYGMSFALCLGDIGFFLGSKLIAESDFPAERKTKALALFSDISVKTILGEMLDVQLSRTVRKQDADVISIHQMKTAYYTITGPLSLGGILAGAPDELLNTIKTFGEALGTAYQIQDDILGVFGDEKVIGKSVTSDIEEGKNTLLIAYALQKANAEDKKLLGRYYGTGNLNKKTVQAIKKVFIDTGSLAYSQEKTKQLTEDAKKYIPLLTKEKTLQDYFYGLTDLLLARSK